MKVLFALMVIFALAFAVQADVDKSVCALPKEVGPCRGAAGNFYFNSASNACESFLYGGCQGNGNRFTTKEECEKVCL